MENNKKIMLLGAGGHSKVIIDMLRLKNIKDIIVLDDFVKNRKIMGINVLGCINEHTRFLDYKAIIAIGNNEIRKKIYDKINIEYYTCIHPFAFVSPNSVIDKGTVVMANATINVGSKVGKQSIINTGAIIEHENIIGDFVHISPGVKLGGNVTIGNNSWIGIGATIKNNIKICDNVVIGAGATVVEDIVKPGIYIGAPAKIK